MKNMITQTFDCWYCDAMLQVLYEYQENVKGYFVCPFCGASDYIVHGVPVSVTDIISGKAITITDAITMPC